MTINRTFGKLYNKKSDRIIHVLFFICACLTIWGTLIYKVTVIDNLLLFVVTTIGTVFGFIVIYNILRGGYAIFWIFFLSLAVGGGTFYFATLFLNKYFADKELKSGEFAIIQAGNLARVRRSVCSKPFAIVNFNGTKKELVFNCEYEKTINDFSKVHLKYRAGLFGFDVIEQKELIR